MNKSDKQRVENALWLVFQYEDALTDVAERSERITSFDYKKAMKILRVIKEEL